MGEQKVEKIKNAYMLFYEREEDYNTDRSDFSTPARKNSKADIKVELDKDLFSYIISENKRHWEAKFMFTTEYIDFLCSICNSYHGLPISYSNCPRIVD